MPAVTMSAGTTVVCVRARVMRESPSSVYESVLLANVLLRPRTESAMVEYDYLFL